MKIKMMILVVVVINVLVADGVYQTYKGRLLNSREIKIYNNMITNIVIENEDVKNESSMSNKDAINKIYSSIYEAKGDLETAVVFDGNSNRSFAQLRLLWSDLQSYQSTIEMNEEGKQFLLKQIAVILSNLPKRVDNIYKLPTSISKIENQLDANYTSYKPSIPSN